MPKKPTCITINDYGSLQSLIDAAKAAGATDLSKVAIEMNSVSCQADHGGGMCYCPTSYTDIRLEIKNES